MGTLPATIGGKYTVVRRLGKGGMGAVFEAVAKDTGTRVAVKVIAGDIGEDTTLITRFQREARATAALDTPHIVKVFEAGVDPATQAPFMAMEYLDGEDLRMILKRTGPLAPEIAVRVAVEACRALVAAHAAGILHRDIKPANLFLARDGQGGRIVKLLDFGVAKVQHPELTGDAEVTGLTRTGSMIGSPLYMSPEQARGYRDIDARSDLWSLGVVLYQMLAGRTPHAKIDQLGELLVRICTEPPPPLASRAPWVPAPIADVAHLALNMEAKDRFPDATAFLRALEALVPPARITEESLRPLTDAERGNVPAESSSPSLGEGPTRHARGGAGPVIAPRAPSPVSAAEQLYDSRVSPNGAVLMQQASTLTNGSTSYGARPTPPPERKTWRFATIGILAAAVAAATYMGLLRGTARTGTDSPASAPAGGETRPRSVKVVVLPKDASVQVDGAAAELTDGMVEVTGSLGSVHKLRVTAAGETKNVEVAITDNGAVPAKIEIEPPRKEPATPPTPRATATAQPEPRPSGQVYTGQKPRPPVTAEPPAPSATHTGRTLRDDR